ncbi:hypothetical protein [Streptomyces poonensis]|uniref:Uncharacterized protein n=1 Tax=Streptomyces poonensis TaxID=68255 RepID=A0A918P9J6_9ACTN|nr:hypothetical protein [Streptomyces poonensis]GGY93045.1 hypothetical protein GCM10010365_09550 [Streptomyces poonensis]GLJ87605.1 hypothetical protein GCM10017589_02050 [Streptomyces poonensis]
MSFGQGGEPRWDPWTPGSQQPQWSEQSNDTPDWAALAEASEARNKRRRLWMIGGGALATLAVGAIVAVAVVSANGDAEASDNTSGGQPATADIPSASDEPAPSFAPTSAPPPLDPKDFIASAKKDTAPISAETLFPGTRLTAGGTVYQKGATASTTDCASAVQGSLDQVLATNDCTRVMRVTYSKDGVAVTVGVALFDTEAQATKVKQTADKKSIVTSLPGDGVPAFCRTAICRSTTNSYGRYAYFTIAGFTDGKDVTEQDTAVFAAGDNLEEFTFQRIRERGEAQASAAADQ